VCKFGTIYGIILQFVRGGVWSGFWRSEQAEAETEAKRNETETQTFALCSHYVRIMFCSHYIRLPFYPLYFAPESTFIRLGYKYTLKHQKWLKRQNTAF